MKRATSIVAWSLLGIFMAALVGFIIPFIGFGGPSFKAVAADAAAAYNLDINDYEINFQRQVTNSQGQHVQGLYRVADGKEIIFIQTSWSRPMVIATIFHEFAHAAQKKYNPDTAGLTIEQHAEVWSFSKLWHSAYRYDAIHLLSMHIMGKGAEYRAAGAIWGIAFSGSPLDI